MFSRCDAVIGVTGVVGTAILITGLVLISVFEDFIYTGVIKGTPLKEGSNSYKNWASPPVPIYYQVWFYDVVNYLEVMKGQKPSFTQKGPYTYRQKRHKEDIQFHDDGTVEYRDVRNMFFERDLSVGSEEDTFRTINIPMMSVAFLAKHRFPSFIRLLNFPMKMTREKLFIKVKVKDIMWGYNDPFLTVTSKLAKYLNVHVDIPTKFGIFYGVNGSDDGVYRIYTGQRDLERFGEIFSWDGKERLNIWSSDEANRIRGSDGSMYPPFIDTSKPKYLFSSDICSSIEVEYVGNVLKHGIPLKRHEIPERLFADHTVNPENAGFCTPPGNCLPSGLLNVSVCRQGAPIVMSMPHFLGCDQDILDSVIGVHPNKKEHLGFVDIEPITGAAMNVAKKLQINVVLERVKGFSQTRKIKKRIYFPVLWLNESAVIGEEDAHKFVSNFLGQIDLMEATQYTLIAVGVLVILVAAALLAKRLCFGKEQRGKKNVELYDGVVRATIPDNRNNNNNN